MDNITNGQQQIQMSEMSYANSTLTRQETDFDSLYTNLVKLYQDVKLMREIYIYLGSFITILGTILNTLCIFIFYKSKIFRNSSFPYYVYVISIIDTINIFLRFLVPQFIEKFIRNTLYDSYNVSSSEFNQENYDTFTNKITSEYHCGIFIYIYNSFTLISVWLMVAVSLERLLVIKFALQTKYMIKLRAFLILFFIFISVFLLNIFDLAPGLYIKPQWYANLTLLCERDDTEDRKTNPSRIYKRIFWFTFNTDHFALIRTLLQTIIPFLIVLIFNSMIIYNFKRIKLAARYRGKSNSMASVNSFSGNTSVNNVRSMRPRRNKILNQNKYQLQIPQRSPDFSISSRSPSPNLSIPNTPVTPTSLVSALNLVPVNKNSYLMPPELNNGSMTPTSTNSSANLSLATTTNLTSSTCINNQVGHSSDKLSFTITSVLPMKKNVGTTTSNSTRVSFKRRVSKLRLNRETDIMLIVLSFSILLSQLPCTIASYLIYYKNIFRDMYDDLKNIYFNARSPMLLYIIRLLEMCYFSLNFVFYITLSPSLRKELKKNLPKKFQFFTNTFLKWFFIFKRTESSNDNEKKESLYNDYLSKIRSVSPVQRPSFLGAKPKKLKKKFEIEPSNKIKIIIDNMYDDEGDKGIDNRIEIKENCLDKRKRMFNFSSPSYLNSLDKKIEPKNNNNNTSNIKAKEVIVDPKMDKNKLEKLAYI
ncbi:unnamed protein product [Brachionus calyciflorus]|uniref:G-protein coupled receptors family 1 profile domain-containing protein n=1 Tax=Brachionus calyciflorus TaxID=104777 RepID=A0A814N1P0_9BILA|nr:unnamed protein product [Brachionus calyciflorus]